MPPSISSRGSSGSRRSAAKESRKQEMPPDQKRVPPIPSADATHQSASKPQQPGVSIQKLAYDRSLDSDAAVRERMAGQELRVPPNYLMHLLAGYRAADEAGDDVVKAVCYGLVRQELKGSEVEKSAETTRNEVVRIQKALGKKGSESKSYDINRLTEARVLSATGDFFEVDMAKCARDIEKECGHRSVDYKQHELFVRIVKESVGGDEEEFAKLTAHTSTPKNKGKYKRIPYMSLTAIAELMTELEGWNKAGGDEMTQAQMKAFNSHLNSFGLKLDNYRSGKARKRKLGESG